jgi:hypothetical protein
MPAPLWQGWPVPTDKAHRHGRRSPMRGGGRYDVCRRFFTGPPRTYFAVSPCERYVKIGSSWSPCVRVREGTGYRKTERALGIGRVVLVRIFDAGRELELECHAFLAPDRVANEWFRVGPRFRVLLARLDREFGSPSLRGLYLRAVRNQQKFAKAA